MAHEAARLQIQNLKAQALRHDTASTKAREELKLVNARLQEARDDAADKARRLKGLEVQLRAALAAQSTPQHTHKQDHKAAKEERRLQKAFDKFIKERDFKVTTGGRCESVYYGSKLPRLPWPEKYSTGTFYHQKGVIDDRNFCEACMIQHYEGQNRFSNTMPSPVAPAAMKERVQQASRSRTSSPEEGGAPAGESAAAIVTQHQAEIARLQQELLVAAAAHTHAMEASTREAQEATATDAQWQECLEYERHSRKLLNSINDKLYAELHRLEDNGAKVRWHKIKHK